MNNATVMRAPTGHPLLGNAPDLARDRLGAMTRWAHEHGDVVPLRLLWNRWYLVSHPNLIAEVLLHQRRNFIRPAVLRASRLTFGEGMLVSSGDRWKRKRLLAQPAFHRQLIAQYATAMTTYAERMVGAWDDGDRRDMYDEFSKVTLAIVAKTLFGANIDDDATSIARVVDVIQHNFTGRMGSGLPIPDALPTPGNLRLRRALRELDGLIQRVIASAVDGCEPHANLIALLLAADDHGDRLSHREVRDECVAFLLAGHETTALALTWTFYLLAQHPQVEARLHRELATVLDGRIPTADDVRNLPFTEAVLREALRLYPPSYAFAREAVEDCEIGGATVPGGSTVVVSQWVMHRHPRYWDRPEVFHPDRWADPRVRSLPRFVYLPFGGGPHLCIGAGFAMLEATLVVATVAQQFRLMLRAGQQATPQPQITLRPEGGLPMTLHRRAAVDAVAATARYSARPAL